MSKIAAAGGEPVSAADPVDRLRREPVERLHGELEVLRPRVLELRVREPAQALDEQHHGRDAGARDLGGVVQRAARQPVRGARDLADRLVGELDQLARRRGSARCSRSAPTRPRRPPRRRSGRTPASRPRASRERAASRWRWSSSCSAVSTTDVTIPGLQTTPPEVQTAPPPARAATSRISSASFAAPASASRRWSIGVEPACAAWPRQRDLVRARRRRCRARRRAGGRATRAPGPARCAARGRRPRSRAGGARRARGRARRRARRARPGATSVARRGARAARPGRPSSRRPRSSRRGCGRSARPPRRPS